MGSSIVLQKYQAIKEFFTFQQKLIWRNLIAITILQILTVYGLWFHFILGNKLTTAWALLLGYSAGIGISLGAHRHWTHKTFKAKLPLRILLMFCYLLNGQYSVVQWVRDHRLHHKAVDTDADPHNARRGFVFSHCGWLAMKRNPEVKRVGKLIDISDVLADPVVQFQQKYFAILFVIVNIIFPTVVPLLWNDTWQNCIMCPLITRYGLSLNATWSVNSFAHLFGTRPYSKQTMATQNTYVAFLAEGEGWHNFHHVFPWDYKSAAFGMKFQAGSALIRFFERIGQAYDLKEASPELIQKVLQRVNTTEAINEAPMPDEPNIEIKKTD